MWTASLPVRWQRVSPGGHAPRCSCLAPFFCPAWHALWPLAFLSSALLVKVPLWAPSLLMFLADPQPWSICPRPYEGAFGLFPVLACYRHYCCPRPACLSEPPSVRQALGCAPRSGYAGSWIVPTTALTTCYSLVFSREWLNLCSLPPAAWEWPPKPHGLRNLWSRPALTTCPSQGEKRYLVITCLASPESVARLGILLQVHQTLPVPFP